MSEAEPSLVEWLSARLDEDEAVAKAASPGPWTYGDIESVAGGSLYDPDVMIAGIYWDNESDDIDPRVRRRRPWRQADATGKHIAGWDPARVLAEVAAKRLIVLDHPSRDPIDEQWSWSRHEPWCERCSDADEGPTFYPCQTVRLLALPYAGRDGHQEAWGPA